MTLTEVTSTAAICHSLGNPPINLIPEAWPMYCRMKIHHAHALCLYLFLPLLHTHTCGKGALLNECSLMEMNNKRCCVGVDVAMIYVRAVTQGKTHMRFAKCYFDAFYGFGICMQTLKKKKSNSVCPLDFGMRALCEIYIVPRSHPGSFHLCKETIRFQHEACYKGASHNNMSFSVISLQL